MRMYAFCILLMALPAPLLAGPASQPDALPSAQSASEAAAQLLENGQTSGPPRLFDQDQGLAVDRSDPKSPTVVGYVGSCWIVPVTGEPGKPAPSGLVLDRGTGRLVARAHEVVPMPNKAVYYLEEWQIAASALQAGDCLGNQPYSNGMTIQLDLGKEQSALVTIQPVSYAGQVVKGGSKIRFAGQTGVMTVQQYGNNNVRLMAVTGDGSLTATLMAIKNAKVEQRFKDILAAMSPRPQDTIIWPADSRPRATGVDGWSASAWGSGGTGVWNPQTSQAARPGLPVYMGVDSQVYVAARVLHPYELPPGLLIDSLDGAKVISRQPVELDQWVGVEKLVEFQGSARVNPAYVVRQPQTQTTRYRARILDLHRDVRRLLIRCQAPADKFGQHAEDFAKVVKNMKVAEQLLEPIVVPLDPVDYKPRK